MPRFKTSREMLLAARDEREIRRILNEALSDLTPEEVKALPKESRLAMAESDLHGAAVMMLRSDLMHRGEPGTGDLLRQVAELYASASVRLSQIERRDAKPAPN